jgi:uncharacterized protein YyaL (SSP411 family)
MKDSQDGAEPSPSSIAISNLCRLGYYFDDLTSDYTEKAKQTVASLGHTLNRAPWAFGE